MTLELFSSLGDSMTLWLHTKLSFFRLLIAIESLIISSKQDIVLHWILYNQEILNNVPDIQQFIHVLCLI